MFQVLWECDSCGHIWGASPTEVCTTCPACHSEDIEQGDQPVAVN
jgi:predicted Zn-ribbon and HTH transcriptional regulator